MAAHRFSIIIPVFNRPDEVRELLDSLAKQTYKEFEVLIVEDGSQQKCEAKLQPFFSKLKLRYFDKPNEGPGPSRNYGAKQAAGDYFIFFDSDCLIPPRYMATVTEYLEDIPLDAYGGPDAAHESFSPIQKAISYAMTSFFTTGGIRGGDKKVDVFHPRSFNMGFSKAVYEKTGGFASLRFGEDLDLSMRIVEAGFQTGLIRGAFVYHKRRTDFHKFFKQVHNSGIARINLFKRHPSTLKAVHFLPAVFVLGFGLSVLGLALGYYQLFGLFLLYFLLLFYDAYREYNSFRVAWLAVQAAFVQHLGYGTGFIKAFWRRILLRKPEFHAYGKNFYK